jgi:hypothetical protein
MFGNGGGASMTTGSSGGIGQGQSSGHHGGRGPGSSPSPPVFFGGTYGGSWSGGSKGGMNGYGKRGGFGLNLSIIASYSFARDWDDETRRAYWGTTRTGEWTWFRGMSEARRRSLLTGKIRSHGTNAKRGLSLEATGLRFQTSSDVLELGKSFGMHTSDERLRDFRDVVFAQASGLKPQASPDASSPCAIFEC